MSKLLTNSRKLCFNKNILGNIRLSILITFCNQNKFIKNALDSIVSQKVNFSYEVLIGLDNGDDEAKEIIKEYLSKYSFIKLFEIDNSKLNTISIEKASNNRLNLLRHAKGEYFSILDGDDFYCNNNRFQKMVDFLDNHLDIIGVANDYNIFDNLTQKTYNKDYIFSKEIEMTAKTYLRTKKHISDWNFMWRNIFDKNLPKDLNTSFFNDSTINCYMIKYGKIYYIPEVSLTYRIGIDSIYYSKDIILKLLYSLLAMEINHQILPIYERSLAKKHKKNFIKCIRRYIFCCNNIKYEYATEIQQIFNYAKNNDCYFTENLINFKQLDFITKLKFIKNCLLYILRNKYIKQYNIQELHYFASRPNFGDELNLYILQRLFSIHTHQNKFRRCTLMAIGSLLNILLDAKNKNKKNIKVFGSGFIKEEIDTAEKIQTIPNIKALRGKISQKRLEKLLNKNLSNIPLGDPGLLASELVDTSNIKKKYNLGVILHYVDEQESCINNIKVNNYKIIDIKSNPIQIIKEMAECEVILSSAMHGLIAADALNIPNCRIILSDDIIGGDYKFKDYYSVYKTSPFESINLNNTIVTEDNLTYIKQQYPLLNRKEIIEKIKKNLLNVDLNS